VLTDHQDLAKGSSGLTGAEGNNAYKI
jgi:hypothetical protein